MTFAGETISGRARLAGVMGWPVAHSLSPRLHGYWLGRYGIDGAYVPLAVRPEDAGEAIRLLPRLGFAGHNVTVPLKEIAARTVDRLDDMARRIGAVNTVVVEPDGGLLGRNTDAFGFIQNLRQGVPKWEATAGTALVLGAGGAARAVAVALLDAGAPLVVLCNRSPERAEAIASDIGGALAVAPWEIREACLREAALVVNTTTLGMVGHPPLEVDLRHLSPEAVVTDIVYAPLVTPLLAAAAARGNPWVDGLGMLLHQARPGFAAWFGVEPEVDDGLREFVLRKGRREVGGLP